jgi:hypothetical protein
VTFALYAALAAVGVFAWNRAAAPHRALAPEHKAGVAGAAAAAAAAMTEWETLAVQHRVNERRAAAGLEPYPYASLPLPAPARRDA